MGEDLAKARTDTFTLLAYALDSVHVAGIAERLGLDDDPAWADDPAAGRRTPGA